MKKSTLWFITFIAISTFSFTILSTTPVKKSIEVEDFTGIRINGSYQVFIKQGNRLKVEIEGEEKQVKKVSTKVTNGIWSIQGQGSHNQCGNYTNYNYNGKSGSNTPLKVYITMPKLTSIALSGQGKVSTEGNFKTNSIDLSISGSGKMRLGLNANSIEGNLCGSGKLVLKGTAKYLEARVTGSGDVDAESMKVENANVSITGSGDINIHATKHLKVKVSGSGDVFYKGTPSIHKKVTGSGGVSQL